jgi:hypothetical protein
MTPACMACVQDRRTRSREWGGRGGGGGESPSSASGGGRVVIVPQIRALGVRWH